MLKRAKCQWCQTGDFIDDVTLFSLKYAPIGTESAKA